MGKSRRNRSGGSAVTRRPDPMGGTARPPKVVKEPSDPALAALRTAKILPVVRDLRSADPKTRTTAAGAIANIVEDARCRKLLLREQIVHLVLSETLADASIESRAAGWAVLNVLAQHEAADFCVHLYRSDVLTPAAHALDQIRETLTSSPSKLNKAQQDFMWRITSSILDLVGQLADARDEVLAAVAKDTTITRALFALAAGAAASNKSDANTVSVVAVPFEIQWAALTTLARLCDDESQRALAETLVGDQASGGCYGALRQLQAAGGPLAVAAASLLHSIFATLEWFDHSPGRDGASDAILVPTLASAIEKQLEKESAAGAGAGVGAGVTEKEGEDQEQDRSAEVLGLALETLAMIGTTLKASLEKGNKDEAVWNGIQDTDAKGGGGDDDDDNANALLEGDSGVFGDEDGEGQDNDYEDMADGDDDAEPSSSSKKKSTKDADDGMEVDMEDDGDDEDGIDLDRDMENVTGFDKGDENGDGGDDGGSVLGLDDLSTLRTLITDAIPQIIRLIIARAQDADGNSVGALLDALSALNNIAWTVSLVDFHDEGNATIRQAWRPVARRIWLKVVRPLLVAQDLVDLHVAAQVAGLAWALSRVLGGTTPVDAGEPARFMALRDSSAGAGAAAVEKNGKSEKGDAESDEDDPFQSLPVKCLGVLGQIALDPAPVELNRQISQYLIGIVGALPLDNNSGSSSQKHVSPAEAVEALNQLFDIYGDEKAACDKEVFWHDNLLAAMEAAVPKAKAIAKTIDKRTMAELRTRADEAVLNLGRFIQYKKKHAP